MFASLVGTCCFTPRECLHSALARLCSIKSPRDRSPTAISGRRGALEQVRMARSTYQFVPAHSIGPIITFSDCCNSMTISLSNRNCELGQSVPASSTALQGSSHRSTYHDVYQFRLHNSPWVRDKRQRAAIWIERQRRRRVKLDEAVARGSAIFHQHQPIRSRDIPPRAGLRKHMARKGQARSPRS